MGEVKAFTLGEVATIITGVSYSKKDPCAKELIEWISGEPASELTWIALHPNRIDHCKEHLLTTLRETILSETGKTLLETITGDDDRDVFIDYCENIFIYVSKPSYFPEPSYN